MRGIIGCGGLTFTLLISLIQVMILLQSVSGLPVKKASSDQENEVGNNLVQVALPEVEKDKTVDSPQDIGKELIFKKEAAVVNKINEINQHLIKQLDKLSVEKLKPVDHLDGVKMEQDGHVNIEYHKEMFLGGAHDEFKTDTFDEAEDRLKEIVDSADSDHDGELSRAEMENWILSNMKKHFAEAVKENEHIFKHLDPDHNNYVTWEEYHVHFLLSRGYKFEDALRFATQSDDSDDLNMDDKDLLMSYKFKWSDADKEPEDGQLSKEEFMVFRHPEHSKSSLQMMVENILHSVDTNKDGLVSMEEFAALPPGDVEGKEFEEMDRKWQEDRRKEFKEIIDGNRDGMVTGEELKKYLDPTNPLQAKIETDSLLSLMDDDKDGQLSMNEITAHQDIFISSKLANFAANIHDEF